VAEYSALLERNDLEVIYAILFDRSTPLDDGERGLRNWLEMFGASLTENLPDAKRSRLKEQIEEELRPILFRDGHWTMDYRRLRIVAKRVI